MALAHAAAFDSDNPQRIAEALYSYNRLPASRDRRQRLTSREVVARWLAFDGNDALRERWTPGVHPAAAPRWFVWWRKDASHSPALVKLYISPHPDDLAAVFTALCGELGRSRALSFKIASDVFGLVRPDKMTASFERFEDLAEALPGLTLAARRARPHGVPFSAQLDDRGVFSWGLDRPASDVDRDAGITSWRLWVTERLAALYVAAQHGPHEERWPRVLDRLAAEGVDSSTWTPALARSTPGER